MKLKKFNIGDLVLRKVTLATKDPAQGKLGPTWEGLYRVVHYSRQGSYHLEDLGGKRLPRPWNVEHLKRYYEKESWPDFKTQFDLTLFLLEINDYPEFSKLIVQHFKSTIQHFRSIKWSSIKK